MAEPVPEFPARLRRCTVRVLGQVQGVGFRPFVYRLARQHGLTGWVLNDGAGVEIEAQGAPDSVQAFLDAVREGPRPLARVDRFESGEIPARDEDGFVIRTSQGGPIQVGITTDTGACRDCLEELFDPRDRRYRHPFINCTGCGPRYTIASRLPYDRPNTSMGAFPMCGHCQSEYDEPGDRRFHAQPNACPECGPRLTFLDDEGAEVATDDPIRTTLERLQGGRILAIKGLGGFHLACDATNADAVARLRARKHRDEKPLAVMVPGLASAARWVSAGEAERTLINGPERPIVLLPKSADCDPELKGIAPGIRWLGVMLPYTPVQFLLFHEAAGRPAGTSWLEEPQALALVMTSANPGGEPLVIDNEEALRRLRGIADGYLVHDRDIRVRCDDSVVRQGTRAPAFLRRARGYTPRAIRLAAPGPSVLACGGWFKNTVCLTRDDQAFVSQHVGDLDNAATCEALEECVDHLVRILAIRPERVARDLHPDFHSSRFAAAYADRHDLPCDPVQHHHAHIAAVVAEHGVETPVLGLAMDGVGLGDDGSAWGGELLVVDGSRYTRIAHLAPLALPGGDRAAREPWRMAASALHRMGRAADIGSRLEQPGADVVRQMLDQGVNSPPTSSAGRLFDAAAGLLGVRTHCRFEGQAAMELEGLAAAHGPVAPLPGGYRLDEADLDFTPLLAHLADTDSAEHGAALFHATLAAGLADWTVEAVGRTGIDRVAVAGGCFLNHTLSTTLRGQLEARGITVHEARRVPPNDGGLSLGQAWVSRALHQQQEN